MKNLSNLELSELTTMMSRLLDEIDVNFSHVSDKMPKALKANIQNYYGDLCKEQERREDAD